MRLAFSVCALSALLVACPTPQSPKGPPPEYEEPPAPSWLDGGSRGAAGDGSAPSPAPAAAPDAGAAPPQ